MEKKSFVEKVVSLEPGFLLIEAWNNKFKRFLSTVHIDGTEFAEYKGVVFMDLVQDPREKKYHDQLCGQMKGDPKLLEAVRAKDQAAILGLGFLRDSGLAGVWPSLDEEEQKNLTDWAVELVNQIAVSLSTTGMTRDYEDIAKGLILGLQTKGIDPTRSPPEKLMAEAFKMFTQDPTIGKKVNSIVGELEEKDTDQIVKYLNAEKSFNTIKKQLDKMEAASQAQGEAKEETGGGAVPAGSVDQGASDVSEASEASDTPVKDPEAPVEDHEPEEKKNDFEPASGLNRKQRRKFMRDKKRRDKKKQALEERAGRPPTKRRGATEKRKTPQTAASAAPALPEMKGDPTALIQNILKNMEAGDEITKIMQSLKGQGAL